MDVLHSDPDVGFLCKRARVSELAASGFIHRSTYVYFLTLCDCLFRLETLDCQSRRNARNQFDNKNIFAPGYYLYRYLH